MGDASQPPCRKMAERRIFDTIEWEPISVTACYLPPSWNLADSESALDAIGDSFVRGRCSESALIVRDFNAWSRKSSAMDARGKLLEEWTDGLGLCLLKRESSHTFESRSGSIVDLT